MKAEYVRIYKSVHTWTGILSGMALFIAFYAGALTVFKEPIARWASPPAASVALPLSEAPQLILKTLAARPETAKDFVIRVHTDEHASARMGWSTRDAGADDHDMSSMRYFSASLDEAGAVGIAELHPSSLGEFIDVLHRVVGLPFDNDPGRWLMGVIAALYTLALISGVIILIPSLIKDFFAMRVGKNLKRMWLDAHNVVGIISLPFHLVMALSAVVFAFHDQIYDIQDRLIHNGAWGSAFQRPAPQAGAPQPPPRDPAKMLAPLDLVRAAQQLSPGFEAESLHYQAVTSPRAIVRVWGNNESAVRPRAMGGFVALDPYSGKVLNADYFPGAQSTPNLFISSFFALHMAAFGGAGVKWMYFVLGMAGAWLFYSGNLLWIETRRKRAGARGQDVPGQRLDTRLMASATIGVCLGCVCGISVMMLAAKWLHGHVTDLASAIQISYYLTFFSALFWSFARGGARAAVPLLWLAVIATLAIPLSSLLGWCVPALGLWTNTSPASLGVDLTALLGALCFVWLARVSNRRLRAAGADTVWTTATPAAASAACPEARQA